MPLSCRRRVGWAGLDLVRHAGFRPRPFLTTFNQLIIVLRCFQSFKCSFLPLPPLRSEGSAQSKMAAHTLQLICHYVRAAFRCQSDAIFNRFSLLTRCGSVRLRVLRRFVTHLTLQLATSEWANRPSSARRDAA